MHVAHVAINVSDLETSIDFYEGTLGLEYLWDFEHEGVTNYYVGTADGGAIQFKYDPSDSAGIDPKGIDHIALEVEDVDTTFERVTEVSPYDVHLEPTTFEAANRRAAFVYDPDGYVIEFVQPI